jgi:hypothetical protein
MPASVSASAPWPPSACCSSVKPPSLAARHAGQHGHQLALPVALDPGDADDLAAPDHEVDAVEPAHALGVAQAEAFDAKHGAGGGTAALLRQRGDAAGRAPMARTAAFGGRADRERCTGHIADRRSACRTGGPEVPSDHRVHEPVDLARRRVRARRDLPSRSTVTRCAVRRISASLCVTSTMPQPLPRNPLAHAEQAVDLVGQQHRGRLVEDEQARPPHQALDDLDALALADREVLHDGVRPHREAELLGQLRDARRELAPAQEAARLAEQQVVDHAEVGHQAEVLVHHRDAGAQRLGGPAGRYGAPPNRISPGVGAVHAEDDVAQASTCRRRSRRAGRGSRRRAIASETSSSAGTRRSACRRPRSRAAPRGRSGISLPAS